MKKIICKLGSMRKAVEWVVYPRSSNEKIIIQSDRRIAEFNVNTGEGVLSKATSYPGFATLMLPGRERITVPKDIIDAAIAAQPQSGDKIGPGVYIA